MINEMKADLVIIGNHGHSSVSDLIRGTVINDPRHPIKSSRLIAPLGNDGRIFTSLILS